LRISKQAVLHACAARPRSAGRVRATSAAADWSACHGLRFQRPRCGWRPQLRVRQAADRGRAGARCGCSAAREARIDWGSRRVASRAQRHAASHPRVKSLDQVLLRLPAVRDMVDSCRAVFAKAYANGGTGHEIPASAFAALAESLKLTLPPETLKDVLAVADVDGNHMISFKARRARHEARLVRGAASSRRGGR